MFGLFAHSWAQAKWPRTSSGLSASGMSVASLMSWPAEQATALGRPLLVLAGIALVRHSPLHRSYLRLLRLLALRRYVVCSALIRHGDTGVGGPGRASISGIYRPEKHPLHPATLIVGPAVQDACSPCVHNVHCSFPQPAGSGPSILTSCAARSASAPSECPAPRYLRSPS